VFLLAVHVQESVFLFAAEGLASLVTEEDLAVGRVYPPLSKIRYFSQLNKDGLKLYIFLIILFHAQKIRLS
jgi:hypothetical protein